MWLLQRPGNRASAEEKKTRNTARYLLVHHLPEQLPPLDERIAVYSEATVLEETYYIKEWSHGDRRVDKRNVRTV